MQVVPLPYKGPLSSLKATELGIGTRRPKSRSMTHLGNRPSLLARVMREARSQEARVQVYAPPRPSCVTFEQQLRLLGLEERKGAKEELGSESSCREVGAAGSTPCSASPSRILSFLHRSFPTYKAGFVRPWGISRMGKEGAITKEMTPLKIQARPGSTEPCTSIAWLPDFLQGGLEMQGGE